MKKTNLLVFQSAYPYSRIKELKLESYLHSKDPGHYFSQVITVNPVASLQDSNLFSKGKNFSFQKSDSRHIIIEGFHRLRILNNRLPRMSFVLAQVAFLCRLFFSKNVWSIKCVYADDPEYNGLLGIVFSRILRVPLVVGVWGNPQRIRENTNRPLMPRLFRSAEQEAKFEKHILLRANAIQVQNSENRTYPLSLGINPSKVSLLPLSVGIAPCHFVDPKDRMRSLNGKLNETPVFKIVCVSRLEKIKHVDHAIASVKLLKEQGIPFELHLVGDGSELNNLQELVKQEEIVDSVIFHGNKSQEWLAEFLPTMDMAVAPLTGRALLEIGLSGIPVSAYNVDWHSDIIRNGESGFLVDYLNVEDIAKSILEMYLVGEATRKDFGLNVRAIAMSLSDAAVLTANQNRFFQELCG
jgi:glycosyltransferase involved in cell wall biosynthesis